MVPRIRVSKWGFSVRRLENRSLMNVEEEDDEDDNARALEAAEKRSMGISSPPLVASKE